MMYHSYSEPFHGLISLLGLVLIVIIVVSVIRSSQRRRGWMCGPECNSGHNHSDHGSNGAMNILKERYAKGEINKEEFETKKKDLMM